MVRSPKVLGILVLLAGALSAGAVHAASTITLPRAGQVGIGIQGGYGALLQSGRLGDTFGAGPTFAVRVRYRMRYERGLGLSFEGQQFDTRVDPGPAVTGDEKPEKLSLVTSGLEFYQMFDTRSRTVKMVMAGLGIAQGRVRLNDGETSFAEEDRAGDGSYLSLGAGIERFAFRSLAYDLSFRYLAVFQNGQANHDVQAALGLIFYAGE
ncbi:MAG TPA: hypothetical protein VGK93_06310 [Candidatus Eisenbacteria bacterium]|jgi:hypothetical protein